ncbi:hypothetical protein BH20ACT2_BH20ACT2_05930 [soil metagenome]
MEDVDGGRARGRHSFLGKPLPPSFALKVVVVAPGTARTYDEAEWRDALVLVEHGRVELECCAGGRTGFGRGDLFWLAGLPLRALHNLGPEPAVLCAISRRTDR